MLQWILGRFDFSQNNFFYEKSEKKRIQEESLIVLCLVYWWMSLCELLYLMQLHDAS